MHHIHTSIVSRHLATIGNNKMLRTTPPHISSSEEIFPASLVAPLPNSEQINHSFSNHTYTKSMLNHIYDHYDHYAPFVTLTYTKHIISSTHICITLSLLDLWTNPAGMTVLLVARWTEILAGDHTREYRTLPNS